MKELVVLMLSRHFNGFSFVDLKKEKSDRFNKSKAKSGRKRIAKNARIVKL